MAIKKLAASLFDIGDATEGQVFRVSNGRLTKTGSGMVFKDNGRMGIGTASPEDKLHMVGNLFIEDNSPEITFETTNASHVNWQIAAQEWNSQSLQFASGSTDSDASNDTFTPRLTIKSDGKVGIGTTAPSHPLQVVGEADKGISLINSSNVELIHMRQEAGDAGAIFLKDGGAVKVLLTSRPDNHSYFNVSGQNLGIGTASPYGKLEVAQATAFTTVYNASVDNIVLTRDATYSNGAYAGSIGFSPIDSPNERMAAIAAVHTDTDSNQMGLSFFTHPSSTGADAIVEAMRIKHDGKVGIGTTAPAVNFHLHSTSDEVWQYITTDAANKDVGIYMGLDYDGTANYSGIVFDQSEDALKIFNNNSIANHLVIKNDGKVGIGTTAPATTLDVYGHLNLRSGYNLGWGGAYGANIPTIVGVSGGSAYMGIYPAGSTSGEKVRIDASGKVGIGTTTPAAPLEIKANGSHVLFNTASSSQNAWITWADNGTNKWEINKGTTNKFSIYSYTLGASVMGFQEDGKVGIGTATPDSLLEIENSSVAGNTQLHIHNNKTGDAAVLLLEGKRTSYNDTGQVLFANNGTNVAQIRAYSAGTDGALGFFTKTSGGSLGEKLTISDAGLATFANDVVVTGNFTVNGTTTTIDTTNLLIEDPLMLLARVQSGTPTLDSGFIIERGSSTNVGFIWDESADEFALINTTDTATTAGNVTIASYAALTASTITTSATGSTFTDRIKIINGSAQLNIGQWDTANHRIEADANRPLMITSYQGNINLGTSGSTKLNINTGGIAVTGTGTFSGNITGGAFGSINLTSSTQHIKWPFTSGQAASRSWGWIAEQGAYGWFQLYRSDASDGTLDTEVLRFANNSEATFKGAVSVTSGQVKVISGAVSAPSFSFTNDTDTGMSRPTTNALNFVTAGAERVRIDANGKVGIGTTSPAAKLDIAFPDNTSIWRGSYASSEDNFYLELDTFIPSGGVVAYSFDLKNNGTAYNNNLVLDRGNVGIGVADPDSKLEIKGTGGGTGLALKTTDSSGNTGFWAMDGGRVGVHYYPFLINQDHTDSNYPSACLMYAHSASPFTIKTDGKVGIGTTAPAYELDVPSGTVRGQQVFSKYGSNKLIQLTWGGTTSEGRLWIGNNDSATVLINGNSTSYINNGATFGIGTASPAAKLHVLDSSNQIRVECSSDSQKWDISAAGGDFDIYDATNNKTPFAIDAGTPTDFFAIKNDSTVRLTSTGNYPYLKISTTSTVASAMPYIHLNTTEGNGYLIKNRDTGNSMLSKSLYLWNDSGPIQFITPSSTPRMTIQENGSVGIGTTSPQSQLHIKSSSTSGKIITDTTGTGAWTGYQLWINGVEKWGASAYEDHFYIYDKDANTQRLVIRDDGNVGIGTTAPKESLHVRGQTILDNATTAVASAVPTTVYVNDQADSTIGFGIRAGGSAAQAIIGLDDDDGDEFKISYTTTNVGAVDHFALNSSGEFGIGTDPVSGCRLRISGGNYPLRVNKGTTEYFFAENILYANEADGMYLVNQNSYLSFGANNYEVIRLHGGSAGQQNKAGINETSADANLHVTGRPSYTTANLAEVGGLGFVRFQPSSTEEDSIWIHNGGGHVGFQGADNPTTDSAIPLTLNAYGGSVGIGTIAPYGSLDVAATGSESAPTLQLGYASNANRSNFRFGFYSDTEAGYISNKNGNNGIRFIHRGQTVMQVGYGGSTGTPYVGIGTTAPTYRLDVEENVAGWTAGIKNVHASGYGLSIDTSANSGNSVFNLACYTGTNVGMFVTNQGRVGIGTTSPPVALAVNGTNPGIDLMEGGTSRFRLELGSNETFLSTIGAYKMYFRIAQVTALTIDTNRNATFSGALTVGGNLTANSAAVSLSDGTNSSRRKILNHSSNANWNAAGGYTVWGWEFMVDSSVRAGIAYDHSSSEEFNIWSSYGDIVFNTDNARSGNETSSSGDTEALRLTYSGNAVFGGTITENSSIALKENVFDLNTTLEKISKVRPVKYNKKVSKDKKEIGLIAEELALIFPELVENDENGNPTSVNYTRAVTVLFDGFKQMYKELKEIKEKIK